MEQRQRLGSYRILRRLGAGAMGEIWLAEHEMLHKRRALEVLPRDAAPGFRERFRAEARALATLEHPNIVQVHDMQVEGDTHCVAMDFVSPDGETWKSLDDLRCSQGGRLPASEVTPILVQICKAMGYAHSKGIIHCNLKPSNVLVGPKGLACVSYFGLARVIGENALGNEENGPDASVATSEAQPPADTYHYMPPEVLEGGEWTRQGDIYSLGALTYVLLVGKRPVGKWEDPSEAVPGLDPAWDAFVGRALKGNPDRRHQSMEEVLADVHGLEKTTSRAEAGRARIAADETAHRQPRQETGERRAEQLAAERERQRVAWELYAAKRESEQELPQDKPVKSQRVMVIALVSLVSVVLIGWYQIKTYRTGAKTTSYVSSPEVRPKQPDQLHSSQKVVPSVASAPYRTGEQTTPSVPLSGVQPEQPGQSQALQEASGPSIDTSSSYTEMAANLNLEMVWIKPGKFKMGSGTGDEVEMPVHPVALDGFWLGKYEVTQAQYDRVMGGKPVSSEGADKPAQSVSWFDATTFCNRLAQATGRKYMLPTEAQWEYACRANSNDAYCFGDSLTQLASYAWYDANSSAMPHPVGTKAPNAWGLYDMHGNVWEWCQDWYHPSYTNAPADGSAWVNPPASYRVLRGGSWDYGAKGCRSANRSSTALSDRHTNIGFRLAAAR